MSKKYNPKLRHILIIFIVIICFLVLAIKLSYMQTTQYYKLKQEGDNRSDRAVTIKGYRGIILDRNSKPLAISTPVETLWVDPYYLSSDNKKLQQAFNILNISKEDEQKIIQRIKVREGRSGFVYLARNISPYQANQIESLNIKGLHIKKSFKRYYPTAEVTSHILGFTNVDGKGQEGIELQYNKFLSGKDGYYVYKKDLKGGVAHKDEKKYIEPKDGNNLQLSIDSRLQYIAYKYLKEGVLKHHAKAGSAIIEDVHTGEILAMVNYPSYNPNDMSDAYPNKRRNRAITDVYELGSVMKVFSSATALQYGWDPEKEVETSGRYRIGNNTVRDFRNYGSMDLRHILMKSSNIGISKIILSFEEPTLLMSKLYDFGFGNQTGIELPGERSGYVPIKDKWGQFQLATLSFGYGMNATDLQLVSAISAIANNGVYIKPTILKRNKYSQVQKRQVVSSKVASELLDRLESVVEDRGGTGSKARTNLFYIAGKTGTARKLGKSGRYGASYLASFIGVAPASNPDIAIAITIDDPQGDSYSGGSVAAPIFSEITVNSLSVLGIFPDKLNND